MMTYNSGNYITATCIVMYCKKCFIIGEGFDFYLCAPIRLSEKYLNTVYCKCAGITSYLENVHIFYNNNSLPGRMKEFKKEFVSIARMFRMN